MICPYDDCGLDQSELSSYKGEKSMRKWEYELKSEKSIVGDGFTCVSCGAPAKRLVNIGEVTSLSHENDLFDPLCPQESCLESLFDRILEDKQDAWSHRFDGDPDTRYDLEEKL